MVPLCRKTLLDHLEWHNKLKYVLLIPQESDHLPTLGSMHLDPFNLERIVVKTVKGNSSFE